MKLIDMHKEWMKTGTLPKHNGLCSELDYTKYKETLLLFEPHSKQWMCAYWAGDKKHYTNYDAFSLAANYGELRQTIVLLICAMHGEL